MPRDLITEDCLNTAGWVIDRLKVLSGVFIVKLYFTSHFVYQRLVSQPPTLPWHILGRFVGGRDVLAWFSEAVCVHVLVYALFWCTVCGANIRDAVKMHETGNFPMGVWVTTPKRELLFSHLNTDKKTWINVEFNIMRPFPLHPHLAHLRRQQLAERLMSWKVFHLQLSLHKLIIILRVYLMTKSFFFCSEIYAETVFGSISRATGY